MSFLKKLKTTPFKKLLTARGSIILGLITILLMWGLLKGCSKDEPTHRKFILVGRDNTFYSLNLMGKQRNLTAFTNDLFSAIATETKLHFDWADTNSSTLLEGLNYENYDAIISPLRPTVLNEHQYAFSDLIFELGPVVVVLQNSTATSLKDVQGKKIGIATKNFLDLKNNRDSPINPYNVQLIAYNNTNQAINALDQGYLDGVIMHTISAYLLTQGYNKSGYKIISAPLIDEGLRLITLHNQYSEKFIADFNQALIKLKENGTYAQLINKWNLIDPQVQYMINKNSSNGNP